MHVSVAGLSCKRSCTPSPRLAASLQTSIPTLSFITTHFLQAYDFGNTTRDQLGLHLWYNDTNSLNATGGPPHIQRLNQVCLAPRRCGAPAAASCRLRLREFMRVKAADMVKSRQLWERVARRAPHAEQGLNMATNAFLKWSLGPQYEAALLGITNMPKPQTRLTLDFSSLLGELALPVPQMPDDPIWLFCMVAGMVHCSGL